MNDKNTDSVVIRKLEDRNDIKTVVKDIVERLDITIENKILLIKPNFVCSRACAVTDKRLVESIIEILSIKNRLVLAEGSGYEFDTDKTFEILGIYDLGKKYGIPVINLRKSERIKIEIYGKVLKKIHLPKILTEVDGIINIPRLKTHALTDLTFAMKNLIGFLSDDDRRKAHVGGLHQSIVDLSIYFSKLNLLTIGDAIDIMGGDGPAFGDIIPANLLIGGKDNFSIDFASAKMLGFKPKEIKYLRIAMNQGLRCTTVENTDNISINIPRSTNSTIYHFCYWLVYTFDMIISPVTNRSLIPIIITHFGTRVKIDNEKCTHCDQCIKICPVHAISHQKIDLEKCRYVRCFKCYEICPADAIRILGYSKPKN